MEWFMLGLRLVEFRMEMGKIASFLENTVNDQLDALTLANKVIATTKRLYQDRLGDDATCV